MLSMMVKFYTVAELVIRLAEAKRGGTLERLMSEIQRCQLLILAANETNIILRLAEL
ncbi:hypothetical protein ACFO1S_12065 [Cohnella boryungensis]|uniref:Uncharacterized protein n=1 Tax=Cohnella boryungensis TaxID=768479 RepID=A0ABV8SA28_9BACL